MMCKIATSLLLITLIFLLLLSSCADYNSRTDTDVKKEDTSDTNITDTYKSTETTVVTDTIITEYTETETVIANETETDIVPDEVVDAIKVYEDAGFFELPIKGVTGYTTVMMNLKEDTSQNSPITQTLNAGTSFIILKEEGELWYIQTETVSGWLEHKYCLINLPSIIPSIIYDNTNTYSSKFMSSVKFIPNITGETLYNAKAYNERLNKDEYIMPILYSTAKKIQAAQQLAISEGNSLKIYEAFRPYIAQQNVFNALTKLAYSDINVMEGINSSPWKIYWFIAEGISNHQRGYAIDVSLVKIDSTKDLSSGIYTYTEITNYTEYTMPTQIHELSIAAAAFTYPVSTDSATDWQNAILSNTMNEAAKLLQKYCTTAGLTPLASEWWHFNDINAMKEISDNPGNGNFDITECYCTILENY
ncbi:MAG: M15 family metallopeptidase [Eubacteriales bacterium]